MTADAPIPPEPPQIPEDEDEAPRTVGPIALFARHHNAANLLLALMVVAGIYALVKLNTQDNPKVPSEYGIISIPTFLVIKGGEVATQMVGQMKYDALAEAVAPHL